MTGTIPYVDETDRLVHHMLINLYEIYDYDRVTAEDLCEVTGFAMPIVTESLYRLQHSGIVQAPIDGAYCVFANNGYYPLEDSHGR